jgi:peptidoglycan/xylan/chitin deacetylase (PgdA/CDA1 family)
VAGPTAVLTPVPLLPPAADGVPRTADVPILMYHYISAPPSASDRIRYGLSVSPETFEAQLNLLRDQGFSTITLRELYEHLATGAALPENPIVLTFDDGYLDNYTNAFPLLQKYNMRGTFFVLTGPADDGNPQYLTWDMIQAMSAAGMDIQLHAREHLDMRHRSHEWLVFHIIGGRQSIEGHTGQPVVFMAYPSGKFDADLVRFLQSANFWGAVTTAFGRQHELQDALIWDRVRISGQLRLQDFARLLGINLNPQRVTRRPSATSTATPQPAAATPVRANATSTATLSSPLQTPALTSPLATPVP